MIALSDAPGAVTETKSTMYTTTRVYHRFTMAQKYERKLE